MKIAKKIFAVIFIVLCFAGTSHSATSYKKNFYRDLSKRLSKNRSDYKNLSDDEFANFREIHTSGIMYGKLFRSSSPVNTWGNRNTIADNLSKIAGVKTFINLADTNESMKKYAGFSQTYYSTQKIIGLNLTLKFQSKEFQKGLANGIKFMARNDAPFLIHCDLGKDRAGIFCAVLECLMGASLDEVTSDYMISFYNYFGIMPDTSDYYFVADNEIRAFLALMFGVENIAGVNLQEAAEKYLLKIGVLPVEIKTLREKIGKPENF